MTPFPPRALLTPETEQGIYEKFTVTRTDGQSAPGQKHEGCRYFVLDLDHDRFAPDALRAYALACDATHGQLAKELWALAAELDKAHEQGKIR